MSIIVTLDDHLHNKISNMAFEKVKLVVPRVCPLCNEPSRPVYLYATFVPVKSQEESEMIFYEGEKLQTSYACPECNGYFFQLYSVIVRDFWGNDAKKEGYYNSELIESYPKSIHSMKFMKSIETISERFIEVYKEAEKAEAYGLSEVAGTGYRKSLEILIKDYLIFTFPDKRSKITNPSTTLSSLIGYLENQDLATVARASTWLGNDHTHYSQRHVDKDLSDFKRFIHTLIAHIEIDLNTIEAEEFINK